MKNLDILAAENGEHIRVLLCREEQSYVVSCQHFRMPYDIRALLKKAKKNGESPVSAYAEYIKGEVAI